MKLATILVNALNGDADRVDPAVRRALTSMANELDEQSLDWDARIVGVNAHTDAAIAALRDEFRTEVRGVRKLLVGLTTTVVTGTLVGVGNILIQSL